jgi:membrane protein DedA with SNARE-associated domain
MPDLTQFIDTWGYAAIVLIVLLGNLGLPVPEETVLTVGGYLAWQGELRFFGLVIAGISSAVAGDNLSYWLGRRYGQTFFSRLGRTVSPARVEKIRNFVLRYGAFAVFIARFVTGVRFMAGPLAGSTGLPPGRFFVANFLGAVLYVPAIAGVGYGIGYGLGDRIEHLRHAAGDLERAAVAALIALAVAVWIIRSRRSHSRP